MNLTPEKIQAALGDYHCPRMGRAWRNRSLLTKSDWVAMGRALCGNTDDSNYSEYHKVGRCLYAACSTLAGPTQVFDARPDLDWELVCDLTEQYRVVVPNIAWNRCDYEAYRDRFYKKAN